jgi:hypothetical protein
MKDEEPKYLAQFGVLNGVSDVVERRVNLKINHESWRKRLSVLYSPTAVIC